MKAQATHRVQALQGKEPGKCHSRQVGKGMKEGESLGVTTEVEMEEGAAEWQGIGDISWCRF